MFARLGRLVAAHPWKVIAVWIVAFAVIVPFSPSLADVTNEDQTSFLPSSDESSRAQALAEKHFPTASGATARFVLKREDGNALSAADRSEVREFAGGLEAAGIASVNSVETGPEQLAENERAQLVQVAFQGDAADEPVKDAVKELRDEARCPARRQRPPGRPHRARPRASSTRRSRSAAPRRSPSPPPSC